MTDEGFEVSERRRRAGVRMVRRDQKKKINT